MKQVYKTDLIFVDFDNYWFYVDGIEATKEEYMRAARANQEAVFGFELTDEQWNEMTKGTVYDDLK